MSDLVSNSVLIQVAKLFSQKFSLGVRKLLHYLESFCHLHLAIVQRWNSRVVVWARIGCIWQVLLCKEGLLFSWVWLIHDNQKPCPSAQINRVLVCKGFYCFLKFEVSMTSLPCWPSKKAGFWYNQRHHTILKILILLISIFFLLQRYSRVAPIPAYCLQFFLFLCLQDSQSFQSAFCCRVTCLWRWSSLYPLAICLSNSWRDCNQYRVVWQSCPVDRCPDHLFTVYWRVWSQAPCTDNQASEILFSS